ncbi:hypothetical protein D3C74_242830 [compost metagenome]
MPIFKTEKSTQLEFGYGDIDICPALLATEDVVGAVCFFQRDQVKPIGAHSDHDPNLSIAAEDTPVRMTFEKVESIDVVIWALEEAKRMMLARKVLQQLLSSRYVEKVARLTYRYFTQMAVSSACLPLSLVVI